MRALSVQVPWWHGNCYSKVGYNSACKWNSLKFFVISLECMSFLYQPLVVFDSNSNPVVFYTSSLLILTHLTCHEKIPGLTPGISSMERVFIMHQIAVRVSSCTHLHSSLSCGSVSALVVDVDLDIVDRHSNLLHHVDLPPFLRLPHRFIIFNPASESNRFTIG